MAKVIELEQEEKNNFDFLLRKIGSIEYELALWKREQAEAVARLSKKYEIDFGSENWNYQEGSLIKDGD